MNLKTVIFASEIKEFQSQVGFYKLVKDIYLANEDRWIKCGEIILIKDIFLTISGFDNGYNNYQINIKIKIFDGEEFELKLTENEIKNYTDLQKRFRSKFLSI
ncbi:hypothetical protein [Cloacibacterium normanense]|uniref:Uncharacterized protein n=1 Tax=Cloacibacterium normanense TaxID=237258 RepID=A0A1E5UF71_9FLAO|nr:hypothetical protein [Cloacibacterium normanense]AZI68931.1 hypothetical protein EB819_03180 [Cloacibacterium normanense]OEL11520.1 hypothetical protein BHF72_2009 [Cloacibacterium normanense]SDO94071.1 hypothetical protein SAMN04489756_1344 [Cloacibacterium normanense]